MKDCIINIRTTKELTEMLDEKCHTANKTRSEIMREAVLNTQVKIDDKKEIAPLINGINRIGNNINQIAHSLNTARIKDELSQINYEALLNALKMLDYNLQSILGEVKC